MTCVNGKIVRRNKTLFRRSMETIKFQFFKTGTEKMNCRTPAAAAAAGKCEKKKKNKKAQREIRGKFGKPFRSESSACVSIGGSSSVIGPKISRTSSFLRSLGPGGRHRWGLLITVLSLLHMTEAYKSVSMNGICKHSGSRSLRLSPEAAITLHLDASNSIHSSCRVELVAPDTHSISLLFVRRKVPGDKKTEEQPRMDESRVPKCPLVVSFLVLRPEEVKMCLDLCSENAFKSVEPYTDLLPPRVTLEWIPSVKNSDEILASEIVIAAVGRGREICSKPDQFLCKNVGYPVYCISKELVCDGKRNCPFEGIDENKETCAKDDSYDRDGFSLADSSNIGRGWEFLTSKFLKKFTSKDNLGHSKRTELSSSTEKSTILWSDDGNVHSGDSESLPDVLKHYGPWGYLMLGMLICGTVLMFCGLWECCCRRPKAMVSNAVGPALLIINQGAQQNELEVPTTPGPPRYEELDQPPSYNTLFPPSKTGIGNSTSNPHPAITLPLVNSISNLLNSNSSSPITSTIATAGGVGTNTSTPPSAVFTIEVQNTNGVDISREMSDQQTRPK